MKVANLFFTLGMASYFTMGSYTSVLWSDFYYTILAAYIVCLVRIEKKSNEDGIVAMAMAGGIWLLYMVRPLFTFDRICYEWIRFCFGCLSGICGLFYLLYAIACAWKIKSLRFLLK